MSEYSYDKAPTNPHHGGKMTPTDMVRYIEELETRLRSLLLENISDLAQAQEAYEQVVELEANPAKAVTRLQHIAANKTTDELTVIEWDTYDMFTILNACISEARTTLAELTSSEAAYGEAKGDNDE